MGEIEELENALANVLGRRHCIITGRGASAIYIALKAIKVNPAKVVIPAICCNSPANVSISAGWEPIFCDIRLDDFNMCPRALTRTLEDNSDIGAIMAAHLYDQAAPMKEILTIAAEHNIPVIEDSAQALGATYKGHMVGSLGDISIISFGHTKTLDIGWGGAALTDNDYIGIANVGAYGMSLSSNYNTRPTVAEIMVSGSKYRVIRKRQSLENLVNN